MSLTPLSLVSYVALVFVIALNIYKIIKTSRSSSTAKENAEDQNTHGRRSKFQILRLLTFLAFSLSLASMFFELLVENEDIISPGEVAMSLSLAHNAFEWLGMMLYSLCLLDRFKRVDMVLQNTRKDTILRALEIILVVGCCFIIIEEMIQKIWYMVNFETASRTLLAVFGLMELIQGGFIAILEFVINVRLVKGTLRVIKMEKKLTAADEENTVVVTTAADRHHNSGGSNNTLSIMKNLALAKFFAKQSLAQKSLRVKMFCYFALLLLMDVAIM